MSSDEEDPFMEEEVAVVENGEDELADDDNPEFPLHMRTNLEQRDRLVAPELDVTYTIQQLFDWVQTGSIDLTPQYQREEAWTEAKQSLLIDSLDLNYPVIPLLFAVDEDENGQEIRRCMDGKQRLTSIQKFMTGHIPFLIPATDKQKRQAWYEFPKVPKANMKTPYMLPADWKENFRNKKLAAVEYRQLKPNQERDVFLRVQGGARLTTAELLRVGKSPRREYIDSLVDRFVRVRGPKKSGVVSSPADRRPSQLKWTIERARDFEAFACVAFCIYELPDRPNPSHQKVRAWLDAQAPPTEDLKTELEGVISDFWKLAKTDVLNKAFVAIDAKVAPLEFIIISMLMYEMRQQEWDEDRRAAEVTRVRKALHHKYPGKVKKNPEQFAYAYRLIDTMGTDIEHELEAIRNAERQQDLLEKENQGQKSNGKKGKPGRKKRRISAPEDEAMNDVRGDDGENEVESESDDSEPVRSPVRKKPWSSVKEDSHSGRTPNRTPHKTPGKTPIRGPGKTPKKVARLVASESEEEETPHIATVTTPSPRPTPKVRSAKGSTSGTGRSVVRVEITR